MRYFFIVIVMSVCGSIIINIAISLLQRISKADASNLASRLPQPALVGGRVYERGQSYKFIGIILNSNRWPDNQQIRKSLSNIRIILVIGLTFYAAAICLFFTKLITS